MTGREASVWRKRGMACRILPGLLLLPIAWGATNDTPAKIPLQTAQDASQKPFANDAMSFRHDDSMLYSEAPNILNLRSDWLAPVLFPDQAIPSLQIQVRRDRQTGEYRMIGAGIGLPSRRWEIHYQQDPDQSEQKGFLQWRKPF